MSTITTSKNTQDLPEGTIRSSYTQDGEYIRIAYYKGKYYVENRFEYYAKVDSIDLALLMLDCCGCYNLDQARTVCQWTKKENKRVQPLYSIRGMEWETPACRSNYVYSCVDNRMDGLRPVSIKSGTKWVPNA